MGATIPPEGRGDRQRIRIGLVELDPRSGDVWRDGEKLRLSTKPLEVLLALMDRPGELVSRDELFARLWGANTIVDFDANLNAAVRRLRSVLGDSATSPTYVETIPQRGYRLLLRPSETTSRARRRAIPRRRVILTAALLLVVIAATAWMVPWPGQGPLSPTLSNGSAPLRLVVGRFADEGLDDTLRGFERGLAFELTAELAGLDPTRLRVISAANADGPSGMKPELRAWDPDAVLEGSVTGNADGMQIHVQLADSRTGTILWTFSYERPLTDVYAVQRDIARQTALALAPELLPPDRDAPAPDSKAHLAYLQGRHFWSLRTAPDLQEAIVRFREALRLDPSYARAWSGLADALVMFPVFSAVSPEAGPYLREAKAAAEEALRLDPHCAEAHTSLAWTQWVLDRDWSAAEKSFRRAIELDPTYPHAFHWYAYLLVAEGRSDEAFDRIDHACTLDPLSSLLATDAGAIRHLAGELEAAADILEPTLERDRYSPHACAYLAAVDEARGQYDDAWAVRDRYPELSDEARAAIQAERAAYGAGGVDAVWELRLRHWQSAAEAGTGSHVRVAIALAQLGRLDAACDWLVSSANRYEFHPMLVAVHPLWRPLRHHPRYRAVLRVIGHPDANLQELATPD